MVDMLPKGLFVVEVESFKESFVVLTSESMNILCSHSDFIFRF